MKQHFENPYLEQCASFQKQQLQRQSVHRNSKLVVNVSDCQYAVVKNIIKKQKWQPSYDSFANMNFDLCWTDNHVKQEIFYKMNQYQRINHFPGMDILSRKNNLGKSLVAFREQFQEDYSFFPNTWMLPADYALLKEYHDNRQSGRAQTFIVKPEASCQGRGIYLTRNIEKLKGERCVVQRYLHKPFLIDSLKFDMRIYVLIAGTDPFRIFVYEEGLARFATEPYVPPRSDNLQNKFMHLTNYAINKNSPKFIFNQSLQTADQGHKRSLSSVFKAIQSMGHDVKQLGQRIDDIIIKTLITGYPTLSKIQQTLHPQNTSNNICFQILGLDIMLDHLLNPILLQINYTPSFTTDTPFDKHVKKHLIQDTLNLLGINDQWKHQTRKKRENEIKERLYGKKRKVTGLTQKIQSIQAQAKVRDEYQKNHLGGYRKIFVKNEDQFRQYRKYYEFAEQLYLDQNRLFNPKSNNYYCIPFMKEGKKKKEKKLCMSSIFKEGGKERDRSTDHKKEGGNRNSARKVVASTKNVRKHPISLNNNYFGQVQTEKPNKRGASISKHDKKRYSSSKFYQ